MQVGERVCPRQREAMSFLYPVLRSDISLLLPSAAGHIDQPKYKVGGDYTNS